MLSEFRIPGRLVLLPGLGLNPETFFVSQRRAFGDRLITPGWLPDVTEHTIASYAAELAEQLRPKLHPAEPLVVAGYSFGGLVALELGPMLNARSVVLISSVLSAEEVPTRAYLTQQVASLMPGSVLKQLMGIAGLAGAQIDGLGDDDTGRLRSSFTDTSHETMKWGVNSLRNWSGPRDPAALPPVHRIHGKHDWIFPPHPSASYDVLIEDGKHVLPLSHELSVNRFLCDRCRQYA